MVLIFSEIKFFSGLLQTGGFRTSHLTQDTAIQQHTIREAVVVLPLEGFMSIKIH
jgi:hypothetical protein